MQDGLYGWFMKNLRGKKGQRGFTLIELLVVVTILGILAAIVTLSLVGLTTNATAQACNQEYRTVQAGLDAFMANNNLNQVTAAGPTNDMNTTLSVDTSTTPPTNLSLFQLSPSPANPTNYVRNQFTQYDYVWNASGKITDIEVHQSNKAGSAPCQAH
jgi:prepilin-type N-terminal cleavage/methylation domain-containing protein